MRRWIPSGKREAYLAAFALSGGCASPDVDIRRPEPPPQTCEAIVTEPEREISGVERSNYLYTCHLRHAYRSFVSQRRACTVDSDCILVLGSCPFPGVFVNRAHAAKVAAARDRVSQAFHLIADAKCRGGLGSTPSPRCVQNLCE